MLLRISGRYPLHTGINNWLPNEAVGLPLDEVTLADLFKEHGYSTHAIGYAPCGCAPRITQVILELPCDPHGCASRFNRAQEMAPWLLQLGLNADFPWI